MMATIVNELVSLRNDLAGRSPTLRGKAAAVKFLAEFYTEVKIILKRISFFHRIPLPAEDSWHVDLFRGFCDPPHECLPGSFDTFLASELPCFRKFGHIVRQGYSFQLEWDGMQEGVSQVDNVFERLKTAMVEYVNALES